MDDLYDPDTGLFSSGDSPSDGAFDPFRPIFREEGAADSGDVQTSDGTDGDLDTAIIYNYSDGIGRYDTSGGAGTERLAPDDDRSVPWQGTGDRRILGADEHRAREAADAGNRNVRRSAEKHGGSSQPGGHGKPATDESRVDSSIAAASQRISSELARPMDARQRSAAVLAWESEYDRGRKLQRFTRDAVTTVPQFGNTKFEAVLSGLKANANGSWVLTLNIEPEHAQLIFPLHSAFGLALDVQIKRHRHGSNDNNDT